jgi:DedD protein
MAFFKFRLPTQNAGEAPGNTSNTPAESVEALRRRARHRLIGASVLVVVGVVGFPLLFDTQPRPVSTDIAVDIPDRAATADKSSKATPSKSAPLEVGTGLGPKEEVVIAKSDAALAAAPKSEAKTETKVEAKPAVKTDVKTDSKAEAKSDAKPDNKSEIKEDKTDAANKDAPQRFVVQVGAFADEAKSREVRAKLEKAGFKTYTHQADTKEGKRTRVRVGPFASRDEADKAASKIKQLQLQPQVLTL